MLKEFSSDSDRYYRVELFDDLGFERRKCTRCGGYFWTLDPARQTCPSDSPDTYSFIGDPPTTKRFDYTQAWKEIESFFVKNNHTSTSRYPVVCRWRDDLYFTIASIIDFQRVMGSKVVFEFPANPLIVPQTCLRFKDLENVGVTGRHFSSFCMIGQHSVPNGGGYWKDRCIQLDFDLLTGPFGIKKEEIVFVEDVWSGGGSFGSSLEYFVRGLELGNAVFTEFQGELGRHTVLDQRIIDMGAGLERFAWVTMGTPTAYDCCFGPIMDGLHRGTGVDIDSALLGSYFTEIAKEIERVHDLNDAKRRAMAAAGITDEQARRMITPLEGTYLIADHLRTLIFAISDGALPSNVGGGYNLRMILRRIISTANRIGLRLDLHALVDEHVDYLRDTYPELDGRRRDIKEILDIESARYDDSKTRMSKIAENIRSKGGKPSIKDMIVMYESDGITPEYLREAGIIDEIPSTLYQKIAELHQSDKKEKPAGLPLEDIAETELLFYKDDPAEFEATVLRTFDSSVVLDRTSFYARGGGQEPDHGTIDGLNVIDVTKHGGVIVHRLDGNAPAEGSRVSCRIDSARRDSITKNHTSTHILNASSRAVLGSWVWQHSAFKEADHARLDITHHSSLTDEQTRQIEEAANEMVRQDIPVNIEYFDRGTAEQRYGFRIYQGGVVPVKAVRIVSIGDRDVEACGGTHVDRTGQIDLIKITRTKRIQDGVVRIEFVSGRTAHEHAEKMKRDGSIRQEQERIKKEKDRMRLESRQRSKERIPALLEQVTNTQSGLDLDGLQVGVDGKKRSCLVTGDEYDEFFHINFGRRLAGADVGAVYCGIFGDERTVRVIAYCGGESGMNAGDIVKEIAGVLGGSGGGDSGFAQGAGRDTSKKDEAVAMARSMVLER